TTKTPAPVAGLTDAKAVSAEHAHACALTDAGAVWCWGAAWANAGFATQCLRMTRHTGGGGAPAQWDYCPTATPVPGIANTIAIDTQDHGGGCALDAAGAIACWDKDGVKPLPL
ncbi:MAG: hypothetical protein K8M05_18225, partial [Deltaproteobacteria bacterium]|nr:hypothetical protein [Kofleriaceae bacterium]